MPCAFGDSRRRLSAPIPIDLVAEKVLGLDFLWGWAVRTSLVRTSRHLGGTAGARKQIFRENPTASCATSELAGKLVDARDAER